MKVPKWCRAVGICRCGDEWHYIGLARDGKLVPMNHSITEVRRWEALAQLGGELPPCLLVAQQDACLVESWDNARHDPSAHKLGAVMRAIGRIIGLRAFRKSARDFPGQGKRNRKPAPIEPWMPPKRPVPQPRPEWEVEHERYKGVRRLVPEAWKDKIHSLYRRQALQRKYWPDKYRRSGKKKVYFEGVNLPLKMRRR